MREVRIGNCRLFHGDCRDVMKIIPPGIVHSVVTDPPYHLTSVSRNGSPRQNDPETPYGRTKLGSAGFMGKTWDGGGIAHSVDLWRLALDCCRSGAHLLAFGGTRTYHRLACAVEDAGFEIRDCIGWLYGSGFPKSLDVSKAIDAAAGVEREVVGQVKYPDIRNGHGRGYGDGINASERDAPEYLMYPITIPATDAARQWSGWGTALKPAFEPVVLARKPLIGTVAENAQQHAAGALNIDASRVGVEGATKRSHQAEYAESGWRTGHEVIDLPMGRFPANIIHDGSDEALAVFPDAGGGFGVRGGQRKSEYGFKGTAETVGFGDSGSASRFFYCAKASSEERGANNNHPTVKPIDLMRYLITLVTVKKGIVLDPFMGSGSTGIGAIKAGMRFVGIEQDENYFNIACERIAAAHQKHTLTAGFDL